MDVDLRHNFPGALPFRRWHIIILYRPHKTPYSVTISQFFPKNCVLSPDKSSYFCRKFKVWRQMTPNLWFILPILNWFFCNENLFLLRIWNCFHQNAPKFRKTLIILAPFDLLSPETPLFSLPLTECPCGNLNLHPFWSVPGVYTLHRRNFNIKIQIRKYRPIGETGASWPLFFCCFHRRHVST